MTTRRRLLQGSALSVASMAMPRAWAQSYPSRPIRIVSGFGVGGNGDITVRAVAEKLNARLGQAFIVENMPGAGGVVASQRLLQSQPDGYTLMLAAVGNMALAPAMTRNLPYDPGRDFAPISVMASFAFFLAADGRLPINNVAELIREAKAKPGVFNIATLTGGSAPWITAELFKAAAGIDCVCVPFKTSSEALTSVLAGHAQLLCDTVSPYLAQIESKALRPLAVSSAKRFSLLPDTPTMREAGADAVIESWVGLVAPKGTPDEILDLLNREIKTIVQSPEMVEKLRTLGMVPAPNTRQEFQELVRSEIASYKAIVKKLKLENS